MFIVSSTWRGALGWANGLIVFAIDRKANVVILNGDRLGSRSVALDTSSIAMKTTRDTMRDCHARTVNGKF